MALVHAAQRGALSHSSPCHAHCSGGVPALAARRQAERGPRAAHVPGSVQRREEKGARSSSVQSAPPLPTSVSRATAPSLVRAPRPHDAWQPGTPAGRALKPRARCPLRVAYTAVLLHAHAGARAWRARR